MRFASRLAVLSLALGACSVEPADDQGPALTVTAPARGDRADGTVIVRGEVSDPGSGIDRVEVAGQPVQVSGGRFEIAVALEPGTNVLLTEVSDHAGNVTRDARSVLAGALSPGPVSDAAHIAIDGATLEAAGAVAAAALQRDDAAALRERINPLIETGGSCFGATVELADLDLGQVSVALGGGAGGLQAQGAIADLAVTLQADYDLACLGGDRQVTVSAERLDFAIDAALDGSAAAVELAFEALDLGLEVLPDEIAGLLADVIEARVSDLVADQLEALVAPRLASLAGGASREIEVLGQTVSATVTPTRIESGGGGLAITLDSAVTAGGVADGYVATPRPLPPARPGLSVAVADDALAQALAALWSAGAFEREIELTSESGADLGAQIADRVEVSLALPPAVRATGGSLTVELADLIVGLARDDGPPAATLAVAARLELSPALTGGRLGLEAGPPELVLQLLDSDGFLTEADIEVLEPLIADFIASAVTRMAAALPLPEVAGAALDLEAADSPGYLDLAAGIAR